MSQQEPPSLHVASLPSLGIVVFAFDNKIALLRAALGENGENAGDVIVEATWEETQRIRAVAVHIHQTSGKLIVVTGGDEKLVRVFAVALTDRNVIVKTAPSDVFTVGKFQKKISCITCVGNDIVATDKFGEVYRITLNDVSNANGSDGLPPFTAAPLRPQVGDDDEGEDDDDEEKQAQPSASAAAHTIHASRSDAAAFLLQHFGLITHSGFVPSKGVTESNGDRGYLVTADREAHIRVSRFPETFVIEQFLWAPCAPQSPVTALLPQVHVACEGVVLCTGHRDGRVLVWTCSNTADADGKRFHAVTLEAGSRSDAAGTGGVIGVGHLSVPGRDAHGIVAAVDGTTELRFFPFRVGGFGVAFDTEAPHRSLVLPSPPVALVGSTAATAWVLCRNGALKIIALECDEEGQSSRCVIKDASPALTVFTSEEQSALAVLDVFAHWRPAQAKDPRFKQSTANDGTAAAIDDEESLKKKARSECQ